LVNEAHRSKCQWITPKSKILIIIIAIAITSGFDRRRMIILKTQNTQKLKVTQTIIIIITKYIQ